MLTNTESHLTQRRELVERLRRTPSGLDPTLEHSVPCGIAFHHAGLTVEEREELEAAFRQGVINVLVATSTLASGVNLPARRVIFRSPYIGRSFLDPPSYRQMRGRAGRKGQDVLGESILMCKEYERAKVMGLVKEPLPPVHSCLSADRRGLKRALLEVIVNRLVRSKSDLQRYLQCSLLWSERYVAQTAYLSSLRARLMRTTSEPSDVQKAANSAILFLEENEFVRSEDGGSVFESTKLGGAAVASSLSPEEAIVLFGLCT